MNPKENSAKCKPFTNTKLSSLLDQPNNYNIISPDSPKIKVIMKDNIWIIDDFLNENECDQIVQLIEELGYHEALLNIGYNKQILAKEIRNCRRCIIDDEQTAKIIFERLKYVVPLVNQGGIVHSVNERFRILKYIPGNEFKEHLDTRFSREKTIDDEKITQTTLFSFHIYLNFVKSGGESVFYDQNFFEDGKFLCEPKKGRIVIFRQFGTWHSGSEVTEGVKYTLRSDIFYKTAVTLDNNLKCSFCSKEIFCGFCSSCNEKIFSCNCSHYYAKSNEMFQCVNCGLLSKFLDEVENN